MLRMAIAMSLQQEEGPRVAEDDGEEETLAKAMAMSMQDQSRIKEEEESEEDMLTRVLALSLVEK